MHNAAALRLACARGLAFVVGAAIAAACLSPVPAQAAARLPVHAPKPQHDPIVPGHLARPRALRMRAVRQFRPPAPVWPAPATTTVDLAAAERQSATKPAALAAPGGWRLSAPAQQPAPVWVRAGTSPLWVAPAGPGWPGRVSVRVFGHAAVTAAGLRGVLLQVSGAGGRADLSLDYAKFRYAYGGNWAYRLRFVELTGCASVSPVPAGCTLIPLRSRNDVRASRLSATVLVRPVPPTQAPAVTRLLGPRPAVASSVTDAAAAVFIAATSSPSGSAGSFAATSLSMSSTWSVGGNSGDFRWSYPLRTPPAPGGPAPALSLSYDSAVVDGQMATSNNQPSWIGEGFDMTTGYIERTYNACSDDMGSGSNNSVATGDLCWGPLNATLSLGGHSGELIQDGSDSNRWHLRGDDGTYVRYTTGASNGSHDGGYWVVTTTDGTQYWFGKDASSNNSAWTVPVYGNDSGEPCHQTSFASSSCPQVWRWNLDHIVDPSGNTMDYYYTAETNMYAADDNPNGPVSYVRGGALTKITYGTRAGSTGNPPAQVVFTTGPRCVTNSCSTHDGTNWPDTPWDMQCTGSPCDIGTPTFWNTDALTQIQTQLYSGSGSTYNPVTTWTLTHTMPDPGDGTNPGLWLSSITQTGNDGSPSISLPPVTFTPLQLANRVDTLNGALPPMNWMRMATITTESGAQIQVTYNPPTCKAGTSSMPDPNNLQSNAFTCYPVSWTPPGYSSPITDFFNKYTVGQVNVADLTTPGNPTTVTSYTYLGNPAWHYTDTTGIVPAKQRTWSVWRGYPQVETDTGTGSDEQSVVTTYLQGMNGDHLPNGSRSVTLPAIDMNNDGSATGPEDAPQVDDDDAVAGMVREAVTYNGPGGAEVKAVVNNPWESSPTASVAVNGVTVNARFTGIQDTWTRTDLDGGRAPLVTSTHTAFDSMGEPISVQQNVPGESRCALTSYARNMASDGSTWFVDYPYRVQKFATDCATAQAGGLTASQVISDALTYYDGATTASTPPTRGLVTRTDVLKDWVSSAPVYLTTDTKSYDANGRVTSETDVRGNATTTAYATNSGGQLVTTTMTNALGWVTTATADPATGLPVQSTDQNGRVTTEGYDALGRLVAVWKPGRDSSTQSPSTEYSYSIPGNAPSVVTTSTLTPSGGYLTSYQLDDGLLRPIQTQAPRGDGTSGALLTDTFYDTAGMAFQTNSAYLAAITPGSGYFVANEQNVPQRTVTTFDGVDRKSQRVVYNLNAQGVSAPFATTSWAYGGDRVDVTPPAGAVATSTLTDAWGNTAQIRQYHGPAPTPFTVGSYDASNFTYNAKGQLITTTDPAGNQWTTSYDVMGRVVSTTDPDAGTTTTTYDNAGDVTSVTDGRGVALNFTYDSLGRKTGEYNGPVNSADQLAAWVYDGLTNANGQLTKTISYDNGNAYTMTVNGFTAGYQPTSVTYAIPSAETGLAGSYTYVYTRNVDGSLATTRVPALGGMSQETLTDRYNSMGQPTGLSTSLPVSTSLIPSVAYTGYGEPGVMTLQTNGGNQVYDALSYDPSNRRLTEQAVTRQTSPTAVSDVHYGYDASGNVLSADDTVSGDNQCFSYDYADRLISAWTPASGNCAVAKSVSALGGPAPYWEDWAFNAASTRTQQIAHDTANGVGTTTYSVPAAGAAQPHAVTSVSTTDTSGTRTASYHYDAGGYTTSRPSPNGPANQTLTYNPRGYLASVSDNGSTTTYSYDANGTMLIERDATGKTLYLPGQDLRYTASSGAKNATRYYTMFGQTIAMRTASGVTWMLADHQDTVNVTIDNATQAVTERWLDPYGNPRGNGTGTWPTADTRGYVGGIPSADGLTVLGARQYDSSLGRFTSVDPIRSNSQPQRYDGYAYSSNDAVGSSDPTGMAPDSNLPPDPYPGSWWLYWSSGWYSWNADGYHFQELDQIYFSCEGISGLPSFQCWGAVWDPVSGSWLDQNDNPTSHTDPNSPLNRWVSYSEWNTNPYAGFYPLFHSEFIITPLVTNPPPPVYGPTQQGPPDQPASPPDNSSNCGDGLGGFLCNVGNGIGNFVNTLGGWENVIKYGVGIGIAAACSVETLGVGTLGCFALGEAATTAFNIYDTAQAGGIVGPDGAVNTANLENFVFSEALGGFLSMPIPGDPLVTNAATIYAGGPNSPIVPLIDQLLGPSFGFGQ